MRRLVYSILIAVFALILYPIVASSCGTPRTKLLTEPRDGQARGSVAVVYSQEYGISLGGLENLHPFDIRKYERIYGKLAEEDRLDPEDVFVPDELPESAILLVQSEDFLENLKDSKKVSRYLESSAARLLPASTLDKRLLKPFRFASGGTLLAARQAMETGIGINIGGGYHHAKPDRGEGFSIYADVPIAIRVLQNEGIIQRALVIDLDVHQGNGTICCLPDDPTTFTFSMHQGNIYPIPKEAGDLDLELPAGMDDETYLALLAEHLPNLLNGSQPDLVFVVAGCDTLDGDPLAGLKMTHDGIVKRDRMVIDACVAAGIPVVLTLSGGYSDGAWEAQYKSIASILETHGRDATSNSP